MPVPISPYEDLSGKKEQVEKMFNNIAPRYDLLNTLLSAGIHKRWRKKAVRLLEKIKPQCILDLATGTGDFAIEAAVLNPGKIIAVDISEGMMEIGRQKVVKKNLGHKIFFQKGDSENLPFPENSFDAVTVGFGVRNFENVQKGLDNMYRVLRPGGMAVILEFSKVNLFPLKQLYNFYFRLIVPLAGKIFTSAPSAYTYLPRSVSAFPDGKEFEQMLQKTGFRQTSMIRLSFGIASIYTGLK